MAGNRLRVAVIGASGYTGAELVRLLMRHDQVTLCALTADRQAGKSIGEVFPHLTNDKLPVLTKIEDQDWGQVDFAFCCLPHGLTQEVIVNLPRHLKIVDLSADFRLTNVDQYAQWYGHAHKAAGLQKEAVYGLSEINRDIIKTARLVANPGCYPTAAQLPLVPLLRQGLIDCTDIIIDAKSGVSGAGRDARIGSLYAEVAEGIHAYGIAKHRHAPEIEQGLSEAASKNILVNFTPHLVPMSRGILASLYLRLTPGGDAGAIRQALIATYREEPFIRILPHGQSPETRHVRGSNICAIGVFGDRLPGRIIVLSAIDNLVKGAAGQAIQNMNLMCGFPETAALEQLPLFP